MTATRSDARNVVTHAKGICPGCLSTSVSRVVGGSEFMFGTREEFLYAECGDCGTLRLTAVPDDLGRYYPKTYYSVTDDPQRLIGGFPARQAVAAIGRSAFGPRRVVGGAARKGMRRRQVQTLLSIYDSVARAGLRIDRRSRILDVGAGSGLLIYALSLAGFDEVVGVDPFAAGDRVFDTGARLVATDLADLDGGGWDLIMFHHSFEHLRDPEAELRAATSRLGPDGRILVRMPTVSSWAWEHYGTDWVQLDAPRHLVVLSRTGMAALVGRCTMRVLDVTDDSTAFQFWGSEQVRRGIPLDDPASHMVDERRSPFTSAQIAGWSHEAERLNRSGRGDQAAWILAPA